MSSVIDTLVYDRTQNDVYRVLELKEKILQGGLGALSDGERAEYLGGRKGAYNYQDLNRVSEAIAYLANRMVSLAREIAAYRDEKGIADDALFRVPYDPGAIKVTPKRDWKMGDVPTPEQVQALLRDLALLRRQLTLPASAPAAPESLDYLTVSTANDIERMLAAIDAALSALEQELYLNIDLAASSLRYAAEWTMRG